MPVWVPSAIPPSVPTNAQSSPRWTHAPPSEIGDSSRSKVVAYESFGPDPPPPPPHAASAKNAAGRTSIQAADPFMLDTSRATNESNRNRSRSDTNRPRGREDERRALLFNRVAAPRR